MTQPIVHLIGAGPGDPGLITVRGLECLRSANVVIYDHLVSPRLLKHAKHTAELIDVGTAAPQPKEVRWYQSGHTLPQQARLDGHRWLHEHIGLDAPAGGS